MSTSYSSPKQLTEDSLKTYRQMQKTESTVPGAARGAGRNKPKTGESREMKPQDKTGSYGEKRRPAVFLTFCEFKVFQNSRSKIRRKINHIPVFRT